MITAIHTFDDDAESRLNAMGLSGAMLGEVCRRGLGQYLTATPYHPANAPGTFMHMELVRSLREMLIAEGWDFAEESLSFTYHAERAIALAVSSGNTYIGDARNTPSFKYPKGPTTQAAIVGNARQLGLFDDVPGLVADMVSISPKRVDFGAFQTWWLLHYVDPHKAVLHAELSLPSGIGTSEEVNRWESRILLAPIPFDGEPDVERVDDLPQGPAFDVEVRKKA